MHICEGHWRKTSTASRSLWPSATASPVGRFLWPIWSSCSPTVGKHATRVSLRPCLFSESVLEESWSCTVQFYFSFLAVVDWSQYNLSSYISLDTNMLKIVLVFVFSSNNPEFETFNSLIQRYLPRISCVLGLVLGPRVTVVNKSRHLGCPGTFSLG